MAYSLEQLQALDDAIASGRVQVAYAGRQVTYRNMRDLIAARNLVRGELIAAGLLTETPNTNRGPAALAGFSRE